MRHRRAVPATPAASPRIDPAVSQDAGAATCTKPVPRAASADCVTSSDFGAFAIALAGGGVLLVGGGLVARTSLRHRRAERAVPAP